MGLKWEITGGSRNYTEKIYGKIFQCTAEHC